MTDRASHAENADAHAAIGPARRLAPVGVRHPRLDLAEIYHAGRSNVN